MHFKKNFLSNLKRHPFHRMTHLQKWKTAIERMRKKRGKRERERGDVYATLCPVFIVRCLSLTFAVAPWWSCHFLYKDSTFFFTTLGKKHLIMSSGRKLKHFWKVLCWCRKFWQTTECKDLSGHRRWFEWAKRKIIWASKPDCFSFSPSTFPPFLRAVTVSCPSKISPLAPRLQSCLWTGFDTGNTGSWI